MFYCTALFIIRPQSNFFKGYIGLARDYTSRFRSNNKIEKSVCTLIDLIHFSERLNVKKALQIKSLSGKPAMLHKCDNDRK
jgi:hypothetical protein